MTSSAESQPAGEGTWAAKRRWLVRSPNPLGDACMSMPVVRAMKRAWPQAEIVVACRENLRALWEACEAVSEVISFPKGASPKAVGRVLRQRGRFDAGLLLPNSLRSALELRLGGVRHLVGYGDALRRLLLRVAVSEPSAQAEPRHHVHRYLALLGPLGVPLEPLDEVLAIPPAPTPFSSSSREIHLGLCPGAEYGNAKRYPVERYAAAVAEWRRRHPELQIRVSLFGSPAEQGIGEALAALIEAPCDNLVGKTTLAELVEALRHCHLLATNDTGTMHLAAALGVPVVAVFGSTEPALTAPIGSVHQVIREPVDCSPCFLRECPTDYRCMLRIDATQVTEGMEAILAQARS